MAADESEHSEGFKVRDKRRFTPEGESRREEHPEAGEAPPPPQAEPSAGEQEVPSAAAEAKAEEQQRREPSPPVDFPMFIFMLANTALYQLGLVRGPEGSENKKDLLGARQTIDLLALLEEKTRGNLTDEEKKILTETLFQLRMAYVEAARQT